MSIKLSDINSLSNGARFFVADLHVHTYGGSHDVGDAGMSPEAVVDQAVNDGIEIVAVTDHNSIVNTQRSIDHARAKHPGVLLVLAGVEVTTAHGHLLVYFAPDNADGLMKFFGRINVVQGGTAESHTAMSMADVAWEAMRLGGLCIAAHIDKKTGFEASHDGYPNWKKDIVTHPGILGVEVHDPAKLCWYSPDDESTPQGAGRKRLLEQRSKTPGSSARSSFAHVQNSDAHSLASFASAHTNRTMTRLKMDELSFQGFRTALADPDARVRVEAEIPPRIPALIGLHVQGGFLDGQSFRLSDNLTCFIGGRGTGKSTAVKCLAHGLGLETDLASFDNCPDSVVVYCRDGQGVTYRYERLRGSSAPRVQAWDPAKGTVLEATPDAFRIELYEQGDLQRVAADPLSRPDLFQEFLDRHTTLDDLARRDDELVALLDNNGSTLRPLEIAEATRAAKVEGIRECDTKLRVAEEGRLKELAAAQGQVGAERALAKTVDGFRAEYERGLSLRNFRKDFNGARALAGTMTGDPRSEGPLTELRAVVEATNAQLTRHEIEVNQALAQAAAKVAKHLSTLAGVHAGYDAAITSKIEDLQKAGLSGSVADLAKIIETRGKLVRELARLDDRKPELDRLREERTALLAELTGARKERSDRRREQIKRINRHLARAIDDYTVVVVYEGSGLMDAFLRFLRSTMQGSYYPEEAARRLAAAASPGALAGLVEARDLAELAKLDGLGAEWAARLVERCSRLEVFHQLQVIDKPPAPIIRVLTKAQPTSRIPVNQLSDGQRHTILLTIAMLAESELPLVIDQPEDDLDNAFVFTSIVRMLRHVKERRQILVVTHNANITVLGDAEMIYPMRRVSDRGSAVDMGSIDRPETKAAVQGILEGGELAFLRRKEIYGH